MELNHNTIISKIYETILSQSVWREALSLFAEAADAKSSVLLVTDDSNLHYECVAASQGWSRRNIFEYWRNFYALEADIFRRLSKRNLREFILDYDFRSQPDDYWEQPISVWMRDTLGVKHRGGAGLHTHNGWLGVATLQFDAMRESISRDEFLRINGYFHHISKAVEIGRTITHTTKVAGSLVAALDSLVQGMFVIDEKSRTVVTNTAANHLLNDQDGIYADARGRIKASDLKSQPKLEKLLASCQNNNSKHLQAPSSPIIVMRKSGKPGYIVEGIPLVDGKDIFCCGANAVLLSVTDPAADHKISVAGLSKLYGLTKTESSITSHLVSGLTVKEISQLRNTSEDTVRTQVKSILFKTNCTSQIRLIRLAYVLNPPFIMSKQ